jgi:hypothetical protein
MTRPAWPRAQGRPVSLEERLRAVDTELSWGASWTADSGWRVAFTRGMLLVAQGSAHDLDAALLLALQRLQTYVESHGRSTS